MRTVLEGRRFLSLLKYLDDFCTPKTQIKVIIVSSSEYSELDLVAPEEGGRIDGLGPLIMVQELEYAMRPNLFKYM